MFNFNCNHASNSDYRTAREFTDDPTARTFIAVKAINLAKESVTKAAHDVNEAIIQAKATNPAPESVAAKEFISYVREKAAIIDRAISTIYNTKHDAYDALKEAEKTAKEAKDAAEEAVTKAKAALEAYRILAKNARDAYKIEDDIKTAKQTVESIIAPPIEE